MEDYSINEGDPEFYKQIVRERNRALIYTSIGVVIGILSTVSAQTFLRAYENVTKVEISEQQEKESNLEKKLEIK